MSRTAIFLASAVAAAALLVGAVTGYQLRDGTAPAAGTETSPSTADTTSSTDAPSTSGSTPMTAWPESAVADSEDIPVPDLTDGPTPIYAPATVSGPTPDAGASGAGPAGADAPRDGASGPESAGTSRAPSFPVGLKESAVVGLADGPAWRPTIIVDPCATEAPPSHCDEGVSGTVHALHSAEGSGASTVTVGSGPLLLEVTPYVSSARDVPGTCEASTDPAHAVPVLILVARDARLSASSRPSAGGERVEEDLVITAQREVDHGIEVCAYVALPRGEHDLTILALEAAGPTEATHAITVRVGSWDEVDLAASGARWNSALLTDGFGLRVLSYFAEGQSVAVAAAPTEHALSCEQVRTSDGTVGVSGLAEGTTGAGEAANAQWSSVELHLLAATDYTVCVALTDGSTVLEWERFLITTPHAYEIAVYGFTLADPPAFYDRFVAYLRSTSCPRTIGEGSSERRNLEDGQYLYNGQPDCTIDNARDAELNGIALVLGIRGSLDGEWQWETTRLAAPIRCDAAECHMRIDPIFDVPLPGGEGSVRVMLTYPRVQERHAGWILSPPLAAG